MGYQLLKNVTGYMKELRKYTFIIQDFKVYLVHVYF